MANWRQLPPDWDATSKFFVWDAAQRVKATERMLQGGVSKAHPGDFAGFPKDSLGRVKDKWDEDDRRAFAAYFLRVGSVVHAKLVKKTEGRGGKDAEEVVEVEEGGEDEGAKHMVEGGVLGGGNAGAKHATKTAEEEGEGALIELSGRRPLRTFIRLLPDRKELRLVKRRNKKGSQRVKRQVKKNSRG